MSEEQVAIVDENDKEIGVAGRKQSVADRLRTRVAFIYVIDPATQQIAITQRGPDLAYQPFAWQPSAGGYIAHGESWEQGAAREVQEELGLTAPLLFLEKISFQDPESDLPFMFSFFVVPGDSTQLKADPREIVDIKFVSLDEAETMAQVLPAAEQGQNPRLHSAYRVGIECLRRNWDQVSGFINRRN